MLCLRIIKDGKGEMTYTSTVVTFSDRIILVKIHMEVEKNLVIHPLKTTPLALCVPTRGTASVVT